MTNWGTKLTPSGTGQGNTLGDVFGNAMNVAQQTGLDQQVAGAAMSMMPNGRPLGNEDQLGQFYHLLASHPNEVSMFFLHHLNEKGQPVFITELAKMITTIVRKELFAFFNSDMTTTNFINAEKAVEAGYSTITDENIDMIIANMVPIQDIAMEVQRADNQAMQLVQQAKFQALSVEQQQQHQQQAMAARQQQQQWQLQQQQSMPPQRPGLLSSLLKIGAVTGAGAVGGAGAQNVASQLLVEQPQQYNQQFVPGQPMQNQQMPQQGFNGVTGQQY